MEKDCDSKRIDAVRVYRPKFSAGGAGGGGSGGTTRPGGTGIGFAKGIRLYNLAFAALYMFQIGWVLSTVGEPYRQFLEKADREGFQGTFVFVLVV